MQKCYLTRVGRIFFFYHFWTFFFWHHSCCPQTIKSVVGLGSARSLVHSPLTRICCYFGSITQDDLLLQVQGHGQDNIWESLSWTLFCIQHLPHFQKGPSHFSETPWTPDLADAPLSYNFCANSLKTPSVPHPSIVYLPRSYPKGDNSN